MVQLDDYALQLVGGGIDGTTTIQLLGAAVGTGLVAAMFGAKVCVEFIGAVILFEGGAHFIEHGNWDGVFGRITGTVAMIPITYAVFFRHAQYIDRTLQWFGLACVSV